MSHRSLVYHAAGLPTLVDASAHLRHDRDMLKRLAVIAVTIGFIFPMGCPFVHAAEMPQMEDAAMMMKAHTVVMPSCCLAQSHDQYAKGDVAITVAPLESVPVILPASCVTQLIVSQCVRSKRIRTRDPDHTFFERSLAKRE